MSDSFGQLFGALVRQHREARAWSLGQTAMIALGDEAKRSRISELENGKVRRPQAKTVKALSQALGISDDEIQRCKKEAEHSEEIEVAFSNLEVSSGFEVEQLPEDNVESALYLSTFDLLRTATEAFKSTVSTELDKALQQDAVKRRAEKLYSSPATGFTNLSGIKNILLSPMAQDVMHLIWKDSNFVSDKAIQIAGLQRFSKQHQSLTRTSLANAIADAASADVNSAAALQRVVGRIVQALEVVGMVELVRTKPNSVLIVATEKLHQILVSANAAVAHVFANQLSEAAEETHESSEVDLTKAS